MLCALYNGHVHVMNYENQQMVKDFEVNSSYPQITNATNNFNILGVRPSSSLCSFRSSQKLDHHRLRRHASKFQSISSSSNSI